MPYLPTNDGPQHVFVAHAENLLARDPASPTARLLTLQLKPAAQWTYLGFDVLYRPLERMLGWQSGLRVALALLALAHAWVTVLLVVHAERRANDDETTSGLASPVSWLPYAFALPWTFYMGFFPEVAGEVIGLLAVALYLAPARGRFGAARWLIAMAIAAVAHLVAAAFAAGTIALLSLLDVQSRSRARRVGEAALALAPCLAITVLLVARAGGAVPNALPAGDEVFWLGAGELARRFAQLLLPGPRLRAWLGVALVTAILAGAARVEWRDRALPSRARALTIAAAVLLLAALVFPLHVPGIQFVSLRALPFAAALALALARTALPRAERFAPAVFIGVTAALAAGGMWHARFARAYADVLAAVSSPVSRKGMRLTLAVTPRVSSGDETGAPEDGVPFDAPLRHMGVLFPVVQGGSTPYLFTGGAVHPFEARPDSPLSFAIPNAVAIWQAGERPHGTDDAAWQSGFAAELAVFGASYEDVVLLGAPRAVTGALSRRGYLVERDDPDVFVGRFAPCNATVHVELSERRPVRVRLGVVPLPQAVWHFDLPPPERTPASIDVPIAPKSCGPVWLALEPVSKDDGASARCSGAASDGRLVAEIGRETRAVRCAVEWVR